ncbi:MAG: hypothetical protein ACOX6T_20715 [Myxococcales bacterium]|jgi:tRNA(Ser,Leu) C12 N-acetylase TAN1
MVDFNVVVTIRGRAFGKALHELRSFGRVFQTRFYNVVLLQVEDRQEFLERLRERFESDPSVRDWLARAVPLEKLFSFRDAGELDERLREALGDYLPMLEGSSFHVRVHRRGLKEKLSGHEEEQKLDAWLMERLAKEGKPGRITFDDPDVIVDVETVGTRAGASAWTREQRERFPFLHLD